MEGGFSGAAGGRAGRDAAAVAVDGGQETKYGGLGCLAVEALLLLWHIHVSLYDTVAGAAAT